MNQITRQTTKEQVKEVYKHYPDTAPDGFAPFHASRVDPIYWDIPDNVSVLDVGCNSGEFMKRLLAGRKNVTVKGVDVSENAVKIAREKGLDVVLGDGESLPYADATFDFVVLMEVLVHVHDPKKMLAEIRRVLKPNGVLLGSCPHKNLEMNVWDDARLHHAYYTTAEAYDLLRNSFDKVFLKVLNGAQFALKMATSALAGQEVEILFRCGGEGTKPWDWQLQLKDTLRVWMGPTQSPGVAYYRMTGFAEKMNQIDRCDVLFSGFNPADESGPGDWQTACERGEGNRPVNPVVVDELGSMLKIADLAVWQITPLWGVLAFFECIKDQFKKPFVTEMDDWLFDIPAYNIASHPYKPNSERERIAWAQLKMSDAIVCSTRFIRERLCEFFPEKPIYVVPNSIDFDIWDAAKPKPLVKKEPGRVRIGYTGCGNHGVDLESIAKPIRALLDEFPEVEFVTSGAMRADRTGDPYVIQHERSYVLNRWSAIDEWPAAAKGWQIDIGIAPLLDSNFNRAKSNLRWLEYSALGVPTVASKVQPFAESIRPGVDGFLCNSKQQWYETLRALVLDAKKRKEVGAAAYNRVKKDFNMDTVARTYKSVMEGIKRDSK